MGQGRRHMSMVKYCWSVLLEFLKTFLNMGMPSTECCKDISITSGFAMAFNFDQIIFIPMLFIVIIIT